MMSCPRRHPDGPRFTSGPRDLARSLTGVAIRDPESQTLHSPIYNHRAMKHAVLIPAFALFCLIACHKPENSPAPSAAAPASSDPVRQKLLEFAGASPADCGRLDVHATPDQLKAASDCAQQGSAKKQPFFVAYDMPGMTVGVAGNAEGKLFTVQSQGEGALAALTSGACPAQLRVASSGRVTCFAPGDMGSMGAGHNAMPAGMRNPHGTAGAKPPGHP